MVPLAMKDKENSLEVIEGVEFICEDPPHSKAKPRKFTVKKDSSNEFVIGSKLFGSVDSKAISIRHASLSFKGTKLYITDLGSRTGTWIATIGALEAKKVYLLEDGKTIVFGAKGDKTDKTPDAIRVKTKILRSKTKPNPSLKVTFTTSEHDTLQVPNNPRPRAVTPDIMSLKPPEPVVKHRRTISLETPSNKERAPSVQPAKAVATTELQRELMIPWSDTFRLGFGVDALTGVSMTRTALTSFKMAGSPRRKQDRTYVDTLHWNGVKSLEDQYEMEVGGTINIAPATVSISTRIASLLAKNVSSSTVLIQYNVLGEFEPEFIPSTVALQDALRKLSDNDFRERYGDYYIAGRQRGYGCRMAIVCQINGQTVTDKLEIEAKALVENFFKAGAGHSTSKSHSKNCSMMHVMIETYGCSPDAKYLSNGLLSAKDALGALPKILANPQGTPRIAILYHYSSLNHCNLPRSITVHGDVFAKIHEMRDCYINLLTYLSHPALQSNADTKDAERIRSATSSFEKKRKNLARNLNIDRKVKRLQDTEIYAQLFEAKVKAEALMRRYDFIRSVKTMSREWTCTSAIVGGNDSTKESFIWECGKVGGRLKKTVNEYKLVTFSGGFEAYEAEWESPLTIPPSPLRKMIRRPRPPPQMKFVRIDPEEEVNAQKGRLKDVVDSESDSDSESKSSGPGSFTFRLTGGKVYVVGWKLSCIWDGFNRKPESGPVISLDDGDNNFILSDRFSVKLDTSRPARWHCKVTFVFQSSCNFPDLQLEQRSRLEGDINKEL